MQPDIPAHTRAIEQLSKFVNYEDLVSRCLGNLELVDQVLEQFTQQCDVELAELSESVERRDIEATARNARRIQGTFGNISAIQLRALASACEERASDDCLEEITFDLQELMALARQLSNAISVYRSEAI